MDQLAADLGKPARRLDSRGRPVLVRSTIRMCFTDGVERRPDNGYQLEDQLLVVLVEVGVAGLVGQLQQAVCPSVLAAYRCGKPAAQRWMALPLVAERKPGGGVPQPRPG